MTLVNITGLIIGFSAVFGGTLSAQFANRVKEEILAKSISITFILLEVIMISIRLLETCRIIQ